ncbi:uncharacterized protein M437DRAFT_12263, partial [Aureobasidium melanogenum CBS 110374]
MALTQIDRKVLAHSINYYVSKNNTVVENLRTVLGISVMLEEKLAYVHDLRVLNIDLGVKSLDPYRELIFLAKEGLALTEVFIAPYCGESADAVYQVMALKLRASFHHIFCQYHNTPPPRTAPVHPPGFYLNTGVGYEPPVSASTFLMPALDYTPETKRLFEVAVKCAEEKLHPAHPLVLSLALEQATFLMDCLADYDKSFKVVKKAARAAYLS